MPRPHITRAQANIARLIMDESCTITRPTDHDGLGALNATTLKYDSPAADTTIYVGKCFVNFRPSKGAEFVDTEGVGRDDLRVRVRLPIECPQLFDGDQITITASDNAQLDDAVLDVINDATGSRQVTKLVMCRLRRRTDHG